MGVNQSWELKFQILRHVYVSMEKKKNKPMYLNSYSGIIVEDHFWTITSHGIILLLAII